MQRNKTLIRNSELLAYWRLLKIKTITSSNRKLYFETKTVLYITAWYFKLSIKRNGLSLFIMRYLQNV
jgi:hypothetical protein